MTYQFACAWHGYPHRPLPAKRTPTSTDPIVLLKDDHKEMQKLFKQFESAGENATERKGAIGPSALKKAVDAVTA